MRSEDQLGLAQSDQRVAHERRAIAACGRARGPVRSMRLLGRLRLGGRCLKEFDRIEVSCPLPPTVRPLKNHLG